MLTRGGRTRSRTVQPPLEYPPPNTAPQQVGPSAPASSARNPGTVNNVNTYEPAQPTHRGLALHDSLVYSRTSSFTSNDGLFSMTIRSPGVKAEQRGPFQTVEIPIFGMRDVIGGSVSLRAPPGVGSLTITMEGTMYYSSPAFARKFADQVANPLRHKHVFLSSSFLYLPGSSTYSTTTTSTGQTSQTSSLGSALKRALSAGKKKENSASVPTARPRFEVPAIQQIARTFSFQIPNRVGQEIPPSFYASVLNDGRRGRVRERASVESAEVEYRIMAVWESSTGSCKTVEAPFLFLPDPSYAAPRRPLQWSETPLISARPIPFKCAISLPHPRTFMRGPDGSIPFYIIFATEPQSRSLSHDIASEATIQVQLARSLNFDPTRACRTTYSSTPSSTSATTSSKQSTNSSNSFFSGLKRMATIPPRRSSTRVEVVHEEPVMHTRENQLPASPPEAGANDISILQTINVQGFASDSRSSKSKRHMKEGSASGPGILFTPDGTCKGRFDLSREPLPTLNYGGVGVKYVITVSVRFGGEELRTAVDIKIVEPIARWERGEAIQHGQ
ncbi:hypothetical protein BKA62DRAFT_711540 [Auriculariales sp. MPI-PUGE-AT-0066]|nr:hypothetical protein BKA62DRAFT_711540 [Auriculariales sp. MPI-PUGE-AT-0066]